MTTAADIQIQGAVGQGGRNAYLDTITVQLLLNTARSRMGQPVITLDGKTGGETIGAISDFQRKSFGMADGRVDVNGRSLRRLASIYFEPVHINPKVYQRGKNYKYRVTIGADGRIFVQPNDWLSKYSAAIYGVYHNVHFFGRMENGEMKLIQNVNMIRAGEVIYHLDTWMEYMLAKNRIPTVKKPHITEAEKKRISEQAIRQEYVLKGDVGVKLLNWIASVLEVVAPTAEILSFLLPVLSGVATAIGIIAVPFGIYGNLVSFLNASDTDLRMYGVRAAAYAVTAWAFDKEIPSKSDGILRNHAANWGGNIPPNKLASLNKAWKEAADAAIEIQSKFAMENMGNSTSADDKIIAWKASLRGAADDNPKKMCQQLMNELGQKYLTGSALKAWQSNMDIQYPD